MISDLSTIIVIPARGGSKRLPRKNVLDLNGKPLIAWTIEQAIKANICERIVVSSDDNEILEISSKYKKYNVESYKRPSNLGSDNTSTFEVIEDFIESQKKLDFKINNIVILQPTSPLRTSYDIEEAYKIFQNSGKRNTVIGVCKLEHPTAWCGVIDKRGFFRANLIKSKRSQDYEEELRPNGAIYICSVKNIIENKSIFSEDLVPYVMPVDRSFDIDELIDFKICEYLLKLDCQKN